MYSEEVPKVIDVYSYGYPSSHLANVRSFESEFDRRLDPKTTKGIISRIYQSDQSGEVVQHTAEIRSGNRKPFGELLRTGCRGELECEGVRGRGW